MNKKVLWPFALTTLAIILNGCGGGSSNINENPNAGNSGGPLTSGSCKPSVSNTDNRDFTCLEFALDYPIEGINFDCSSAPGQHFATRLSQNAVIGSCKTGDTARFYLQGKDNKQIFLGNVKLDTIGKYTVVGNNGTTQMSRPVYLRLLDLATGITGKTPVALDKNDETIKVAMALIKIFQSIGVENNDNLIGDIQPTDVTDEKKAQLTKLSQSITAADFQSGAYVSILKPWLDVSQISDDEAYRLVVQTTNLSNAGVLEGFDLAILRAFRGCNSTIKDCESESTTLRRAANSMYLISDRQGYSLGYGLQWKGSNVKYAAALLEKEKPIKMTANAQKNWIDPISREIQPNTPLSLSISDDINEDLQIYQGKFINNYAVAGTETFYKGLTQLSTGNPKHYGLWRQSVGGETYNGVLDIVKEYPISYLEKSVFKTARNVKAGENYIFPLNATLTFNFATSGIQPVSLGIVIDENGDIRTDIKPNATPTDMSGQCATVSDATLIDSNGIRQYRIGTTAATLDLPTQNDQSIFIRMILSNPKFANINGAMVGVTFTLPSAGTAKLNLFNLLANKVDDNSINLNNGAKELASWFNEHAFAQNRYNNVTKLTPTEDEKALAKRIAGTVTIKLADQSIPACKAIKTKS
ncbi:protein FilF [Acinetobacter pittii]|uniref:putative pilus system protein FilF n=1 Tax=Acinetobacter pittii TaxID=48296 RepID=UPI00313AF9F6